MILKAFLTFPFRFLFFYLKWLFNTVGCPLPDEINRMSMAEELAIYCVRLTNIISWLALILVIIVLLH